MPARVACEAIEAARAAGPPPRAAGATAGTFHQLQDTWLAEAMPGEVLPQEPAARKEAWRRCRKRYQDAMRAAAVREETLVDLRPADRPWAPDDGAGKKDWYVLPKDPIVTESWWTDNCPELEGVEAGAPQLTPNRTRAVRRFAALRAAEGAESEGEVEDEVHYTLGGEDRASARNRRRDKIRKREKACLKRMNDGARACRGLFTGGEGEGGAGGGGGEPPRRPSLLGTAIPPPPPRFNIPAIGGGGSAFGCDPCWGWGGGGGGGEPGGGFYIRW